MNAIPMSAAPTERTQRVLDRLKKLEADRALWEPAWDEISKYVMGRSTQFQYDVAPGQFLTSDIWDGTAGKSNSIMASAITGAMWPNSGDSVRLDPPAHFSYAVKSKKEIKDWCEMATCRVVEAFNSPASKFMMSLEECMREFAYGTSGMVVMPNSDESDIDTPVMFESFDVKTGYIDEDNQGNVSVVYRKREWTARQIVQEFGVDSVSKEVREAMINNEPDKKFWVVHAIEPRVSGMTEMGNQAMPFASMHIEKNTVHVLKESGYGANPVIVARLQKHANEKYGRSPAWESMADIHEVNVLREAYEKATEKVLDPPLQVHGDPQDIFTGAGDVNFRMDTGRIGDNQRWIEPISTVGELQTTNARIETLQATIKEYFYVDLLLDLNNKTRMTLGEAQMRDTLRGQALGLIFARLITELFSPMVNRVFNILLERGLLGKPAAEVQRIKDENQAKEALGLPLVFVPDIMPEEIVEAMTTNRDAYKIVYTTPASRIMRADELKGILQTIQAICTELAPVAMEALDVIDIDEVVRQVVELTGAPSCILRSAEDIQARRDARAQAQQSQSTLLAQSEVSKTAKATAQAAEHATKAGVDPLQFIQGLGSYGQQSA
jgi:hypothetical protein